MTGSTQIRNNPSHKDLSYRESSLADIAGCKHLATIAYGKYRPVLTDENWDKMYFSINADATWQDIITKSKGYVCMDENIMAGMAFLVPSGHPWDIFRAEWSYVRMVAVHPEYEGMGIARKLMQQLIDHAKATGENTIALHTSENMVNARHLYESMGFCTMYQIPDRLGMKYWLYTLELT